jgi:hypothetical protein
MTNRACSLEGDVGVNTWRDRLLRKLGPEFKIAKGNDREMLMKHCEVRLWEEPQVGIVEVAFVSLNVLDGLPDNVNPILTTHSTADKNRLESILSNRWKVITKDTNRHPVRGTDRRLEGEA